MTQLFSKVQFTTASFALIGMNLIPLIGVFWFGWDAGTIVFLYWLENVIIGVLNIPKILSCRASASGHPNRRETLGGLLFLSGFFSIHYGLFCFGHYMFLESTYASLPAWEDMLAALTQSVLLWSLLGLTFSHMISLFVNFYGKGEYKTRTPNKQMFMPYPRILILHVVIVFSGLIAVALGESLAILVLLILVKIGFDLAAHLAEHSKKESFIAPSVN
jgi:hypothetical protein